MQTPPLPAPEPASRERLVHCTPRRSIHFPARGSIFFLRLLGPPDDSCRVAAEPRRGPAETRSNSASSFLPRQQKSAQQRARRAVFEPDFHLVAIERTHDLTGPEFRVGNPSARRHTYADLEAGDRRCAKVETGTTCPSHHLRDRGGHRPSGSEEQPPIAEAPPKKVKV